MLFGKKTKTTVTQSAPAAYGKKPTTTVSKPAATYGAKLPKFKDAREAAEYAREQALKAGKDASTAVNIASEAAKYFGIHGNLDSFNLI